MNNTKPAFTDCATDGKRKELAERFTHYLKSRKTEKNAYVVNLNGAWGTGKTYFVTEWKKLVEEQGHIAVKIDAWESDYLNDPLAIIIAELLEQVRDRIENYDKDFEDKEKEVANAILNIGKDILPILAKILGKHLLGKAATDDIVSLLGKATGSLLSNEKLKEDLNIGELGLSVVRQHKQHKQFTQDFKKQARDLVDFALEGNPNKQVFVFIDELDRCRPTYAIEMLETVKHLFDIPNFIFVLSTDTNQLQHSIKAVYGHDFDSHEYLSRFFEQRLILPEPDFLQFMTAHNMFRSVKIEALNSFPSIQNTEELREAVNVICRLNKTSLSLRRLKQICSQLEVVLTSKDFKEVIFPIFDLIGIVFGDSLYGGLTNPDKSIDKAMLAYKSFGNKGKIEDFQLGSNKASDIISKLCVGLSHRLNGKNFSFNNSNLNNNNDGLEPFNFTHVSLNTQLGQIYMKTSTLALCVKPQQILDAINNIRVDIEL
ncbi:P-loop NTPase fold protein [Marinomonas sp. GJ51-6]|uniref:KAP family P-loop NTPase fold protein n=1 Tax=Marinomonas sp. GJ51-6 TaxID=2992802 RepID=UPI002934A40C|nr:P-loop NTPase fold protein [Marinomonas sp. GJ51-6]WOD08975.1 P-loop NTPase fold protein [Marinomonas sp. GJ51-6]